MRIMLLGDTHGDSVFFSRAVAVAAGSKCSKIFQVGDFGYWPRSKFGQDFLKSLSRLYDIWGIEIYWLDGNHEDHDVLNDKVKVAQDVPGKINDEGFINIARGVWYSPRGHRWEWDGVKFLSLGGAYSLNRRRLTKHESWFPQEVISEGDVEVCGTEGVDVLLTHDAPDGVAEADYLLTNFSPFNHSLDSLANQQKVTRVLRATRPSLLVHGHLHFRYVDTFEGTTVLGLAHNHTSLSSAAWILDTEEIRGSDPIIV